MSIRSLKKEPFVYQFDREKRSLSQGGIFSTKLGLQAENSAKAMNIYPVMPFNDEVVLSNIDEFQDAFLINSIDLSPVALKNGFSAYPIAVDDSSLLEAKKLHQTLCRALMAVVNAYFEDERIRQIVSLSSDAEMILREANSQPYSIGSFRPDVILDSHGIMRICEINARFPTNGFFVSHGLNQMLPRLSYSQSVTSIPLLQEIPRAFADFFDPSAPIVIVKGREKGGDIHVASTSFESQGFVVRFVPPESLFVDDGKLHDELGGIEQVILELHQNEIEALPIDVISALAHLPRCLNDLRTIFIVHDKRLLAVLKDESIMSDLLEPEDVAVLQANIIQTAVVSQLSPSMQFELNTHRENWLIKPSKSGKGDGVLLGKNVSAEDWEKVLADPANAEYVIQQFIPPQKLLVADADSTSLRASQSVIGVLLCFSDRFFGLGVFRTSAMEVINASEGANLVIPALIREEKRVSYIQTIKNSPLNLIYQISSGIASVFETQKVALKYPTNYWPRNSQSVVRVDDKSFGNTYARTIQLSDMAREAWRKRLMTQSLSRSFDSLAGPLRAATQIPEVALDAIMSIADDPFGPPAILLRNVPIDLELPPTPLDGGDAPGLGTIIADNVLLGIARTIGQPIGFHGLKNGTLTQTIAPTSTGGDGMSNEGAKTRFHFHIESAFSPNRASHLLLLCLRSDHEGVAQTELVDAQSAYNALSLGMKNLLRQPLFVTMAPESFKDDHRNQVTCAPRPVVTGPEETPEFCFNLQSTQAITEDAQAALEQLARELMVMDRILQTKLRPGDLLLFDNRRVLHARSPFSARLDGTDRWLRRLYVAPDLWASRPERAEGQFGPRVLDPIQMPWNQCVG